MSEGDHAFAVRGNEEYAWHAANTFHKNGRRPRVYEVEPVADDLKPGPWNMEHPDHSYHAGYDPTDEGVLADVRENEHLDEWGSKTGFKVTGRIDIMPGRQGTFPSVNWNRFKNTHPAAGPDANHPSTHTEVHGHVKGHELDKPGGVRRARDEFIGLQVWGEDRAKEINTEIREDPKQGRLF